MSAKTSRGPVRLAIIGTGAGVCARARAGMVQSALPIARETKRCFMGDLSEEVDREASPAYGIGGSIRRTIAYRTVFD